MRALSIVAKYGCQQSLAISLLLDRCGREAQGEELGRRGKTWVQVGPFSLSCACFDGLTESE